MGNDNKNQQWNVGRVYYIVSESAAVDGVLVPSDSVQHVRDK